MSSVIAEHHSHLHPRVLKLCVSNQIVWDFFDALYTVPARGFSFDDNVLTRDDPLCLKLSKIILERPI